MGLHAEKGRWVPLLRMTPEQIEKPQTHPQQLGWRRTRRCRWVFAGIRSRWRLFLKERVFMCTGVRFRMCRPLLMQYQSASALLTNYRGWISCDCSQRWFCCPCREGRERGTNGKCNWHKTLLYMDDRQLRGASTNKKVNHESGFLTAPTSASVQSDVRLCVDEWH